MNFVSIMGSRLAPSKIVCIGRNYVDHIAELGNEIADDMVVFNKPNSALGEVLHSHLEEPLHYEGELAFCIRNGKLSAVGFGLDLTKRALQAHLKSRGLPWERAKAFDGAALFSDFVELPSNIEDLSLRLFINDEQRQSGGVDLMIYPPDVILRELAKFTTLEDGDILMTGTPAGVGTVNPGDTFCGQVCIGEQVLVSRNWVAQ